jgi:hypothetical protein
MKILTPMLFGCALAAALPARAYCLHNELPDRDVYIEQARLKSNLREGNELRVALKPGEKHCCRNLNCNPGGRSESTVELTVSVLGQPEYKCAPERVEGVTITGDGVLRVQRNTRKSELSPYIVRIRSGQKDLTGPRGVTCLEKKGTKK